MFINNKNNQKKVEKKNVTNFVLFLVIISGLIFIIKNNLWLNGNLIFYWKSISTYTEPLHIFFYFLITKITINNLLYIFSEKYRKNIKIVKKNNNFNYFKYFEIALSIVVYIPLILIILTNNNSFMGDLNLYLTRDIFYKIQVIFTNLIWFDIDNSGPLFIYGQNTISRIINSLIENIFFDGLSLWLSWLTLFIYYIIYCNKNKHSLYLKIQKYYWNKTFFNSMLEIIIFLMLICFLTKNIYIYFIAFEMILIPLVIYITFNGSRFDKITAIKYLVVYTIVGSIFLWISIAYIVENIGTSNYDSLQWLIQNSVNPHSRKLLFLGIFFGFSFKIPMVPFHHWLISAHVEAPTNGSIILAALLLKVGGYGIYRFAYNLFPNEAYYFSNEIILWCVFGYTYATIQAIRQIDIKRYIAYTSISHMNFALIGLFSNSDFGVIGFIHTMISHGIISTAMFFIVGHIYNNLNFRDTIRLSGISLKMPKTSFYFFIFSIANIGIPLFSGFPGEMLILASVVNYNLFYAMILIVSFMLTGYYNFYQINKLLFNVGRSDISNIWKLKDIDKNSQHILILLTAWTLLLGITPDLVFASV